MPHSHVVFRKTFRQGRYEASYDVSFTVFKFSRCVSRNTVRRRMYIAILQRNSFSVYDMENFLIEFNSFKTTFIFDLLN